MTKIVSEDYRGRGGVGFDARRLWSGGAASAVVAGLVALTGVLVSRWVFNVPVLALQHDGAYGDARTTGLILAAIAAALIATGLIHVLMLSTMRPLMFLGWIVALVTTIVAVFPFSTTAPLDARIATAVLGLAIGIVTGTLVGGVAERSATGAGHAAGDPPPLSYDQPRPTIWAGPAPATGRRQLLARAPARP